jgi:hypothetical protein
MVFGVDAFFRKFFPLFEEDLRLGVDGLYRG